MVVRLAFENGVRAVQLFGCADADELMWEGEHAQGPGAVCLGAQRRVKPVRTTNEEGGVAQSAVHQSLQVLRQLDGAHLSSVLVEEDEVVDP